MRVAGVRGKLYGSRGLDDLPIVAARDEGHDCDVGLAAALVHHHSRRNGIEKGGPVGLVAIAKELIGTFLRFSNLVDSQFRDRRKEGEVAILCRLDFSSNEGDFA